MNSSLKNVDMQIDNLMEFLHGNNLLNCVDIIVVSDHGMTSLKDKVWNRFVFNEMILISDGTYIT